MHYSYTVEYAINILPTLNFTVYTLFHIYVDQTTRIKFTPALATGCEANVCFGCIWPSRESLTRSIETTVAELRLQIFCQKPNTLLAMCGMKTVPVDYLAGMHSSIPWENALQAGRCAWVY